MESDPLPPAILGRANGQTIASPSVYRRKELYPGRRERISILVVLESAPLPEVPPLFHDYTLEAAPVSIEQFGRSG
jgi:hypothetical protein